MLFNGKIVACRVFEQDSSPTSHNNHFRLACHRRITAPMFNRVHENTLRFTAYVFECGDRSGVPLHSGGGMEAEQMGGHAPY